MHPPEFVRQMLAKNQPEVLIEMLRKTSKFLIENQGNDPHGVYGLALAFLIDVRNSLKELPAGTDIDNEKVLSVWAELAFFGIKRDDISDFLDEVNL